MFKTNCFSGELKDSDEGHLFWIKPEDLDKYTLSADLKEMIEVMMNDNLSEFISLRDENDNELSKKLL
jgi:8-oxo-dGTP diphosphatase